MDLSIEFNLLYFLMVILISKLPSIVLTTEKNAPSPLEYYKRNDLRGFHILNSKQKISAHVSKCGIPFQKTVHLFEKFSKYITFK